MIGEARGRKQMWGGGGRSPPRINGKLCGAEVCFVSYDDSIRSILKHIVEEYRNRKAERCSIEGWDAKLIWTNPGKLCR